jgi:hypothetical protein
LKANQQALLEKSCMLLINVLFLPRCTIARACHEPQQHLRDDVCARRDPFVAAAAVSG